MKNIKTSRNGREIKDDIKQDVFYGSDNLNYN